MSFINLKLSKKKSKENKVTEAPSLYDGPDYSYGTRLSFEKETIGKLGIDLSKVKVGESVTASVKLEVISVRQEVSKGGNSSENIEFQITDIDLGKVGKSAVKEKMDRYNAIKNELPTQD